MFEEDYEDVVTVLKPKAGTLAVGGVPTEWETLLDDQDDPQPVRVECAFSERGRRVTDSQGDQIDTDGTLLFRGDDPAALEKGWAVVTEDGRAFEILDLQVERLRGSTGVYGRASLKLRADLPQEVDDE